MADIAIAAVIRKVIDILGNLVLEEAIRWYRLREHVEWIERELRRMQSFLKDADAKQEGDYRVKNWVQDVRDLAHDSEDIIDAFLLKIIRNQRRRKGCAIFLRRSICIFCDHATTHEFTMEIEKLKRRVEDIKRSRDTYGIGNLGSGGAEGANSEHDRQIFSQFDKPEVVGLENEINSLVGRLLDESIHSCVIAIVGMGGLGKTTITKKIYNDVKENFVCCAWVYVSQKPRPAREILQDIGKQVGLNKQEWEENVEENLLRFLQDKRYVIVLDDLWANQVWDNLNVVFPKGANGSRIILTTRIIGVAKHAAPCSPVHTLRYLNQEESWELFSRKVFPGQTNASGRFLQGLEDLEDLGRKIVGKCGDLPLAIVVMGGLLSLKERTYPVWSRVLGSMGEAPQNQYGKALQLSYNDLPSNLKPCFLYFGLFPENHEIPVRRLINLWVAEGFVQPRGRLTLEDAAEEYLDDLILRNLVQPVKRGFDGRMKTCCIHDLLHEFCISKAKEDNFFYVCDGLYNADARMRRLVTYHSLCECISLKWSTDRHRSLLCFEGGNLERKQLEFIYYGFRFLRVLNLEGVQSQCQLPDEIGDLIFLRYFALRNTGFTRIPSTMGKLKYLQTLDIQSTKCFCIPSVIWKMKQLRHIILGTPTEFKNPFKRSYPIKYRKPSVNKVSLTNLQTLWMIPGHALDADWLCKFTNLRKLGIYGDVKLHAKVLSNSKPISEHLENLQLEGQDIASPVYTGISDLVISRYENLRKVYLGGKLEKLPNHDEFPAKLTKLSLFGSRLNEDPMATLAWLPRLRILKLDEASYLGVKMACSEASRFQQLEVLTLRTLPNLEEWRVDEIALPKLRILTISSCRKLNMLPDGLKNVSTLTKLIIEMPEEFNRRLQQNGEFRDNIRHATTVIRQCQ
ncbi:PREDICTED: probable disease resistance protein RF45 [Nelumbo nucifera]|uniref:Uncharacterized protein n=2 Tax=Nelumbo nucifera TaxID=4432 RepID=A0A822XQG9_NELNU|nr:PREDICTED: probable disease resistance protein RF45 [Nelumbo nucifera]DAD23854.1 TPA_asm: hypothetical protein HUJ06_025317 [Nelumbo nucifera]